MGEVLKQHELWWKWMCAGAKLHGAEITPILKQRHDDMTRNIIEREAIIEEMKRKSRCVTSANQR